MQTSTTPAPVKPWQRAGAGVGAALAPPPVAAAVASPDAAAAPAAAAALGAATPSSLPSAAASFPHAATSSRASLSPASTSYGSSMYGGYGSSYGSGMYGGYGSSMYGRSSMYGGGYGGGMYGRSMYGGYGSSMYGNSMYGGGMGSMYGGGMGGYGGRPGMPDGEFWAPKPPQDEAPRPSRLGELQNINHLFLDSVHGYGDRLVSAVRRMLNIWACSGGLEDLRATLRSGEAMGRPAVRRGTGLTVVAAILAFIAWRLQRRNRRLAWERLFATASGRLALPSYHPLSAAL